MPNLLSGLFKKGGRSRKNKNLKLKSKSKRNSSRRSRTLRGGAGDDRATVLESRRN